MKASRIYRAGQWRSKRLGKSESENEEERRGEWRGGEGREEKRNSQIIYRGLASGVQQVEISHACDQGIS